MVDMLIILVALGLVYALGFLSGTLAGILKTYPWAKSWGHSEGYKEGLTANVERMILTKAAGGEISAEVRVHTAVTEWPTIIDN